MLLLQYLRVSPLPLGAGAVCQKSSFVCFLSAICLRQRAVFFILLRGQNAIWRNGLANGSHRGKLARLCRDIISSTCLVNRAPEKRGPIKSGCGSVLVDQALRVLISVGSAREQVRLIFFARCSFVMGEHKRAGLTRGNRAARRLPVTLKQQLFLQSDHFSNRTLKLNCPEISNSVNL